MKAFVHLLAALALSGVAAFAHQGHAPLTLDDLARNALVIVEARVDSVKSAWNADRTQIRTTVSLKADTFYKGDDGSTSLEIVQLGGVVEEDGLAVIGQPAFRAGERVVVFLRADWKQSDVPVVQMEHGKFTVTTNAAGDDTLTNAAGARYAKGEMAASIRVMNAAAGGGRP